jgi:nicotinate phosphoribosyltransferase
MKSYIVSSRLDNDFYNFTMAQLVWRHYPEVEVTYEFTNRTRSIRTAELVDLAELRAEIDHVRALRFTADELAYLGSLKTFDPAYLRFLATSRLPQVELCERDGQITVRTTGRWATAIFWETPLLAIINELANRARSGKNEVEILADADRRLDAKIAQIAAHPRIKLVEFGTRRRFSATWQRHVTQRLQAELPGQLSGTTNVALAHELGLTPFGTMAHQLFMVTTALAEAAGSIHPIAESQATVLDLFEAEFGQIDNGRLLKFLPDTYGSDTALSLLEPERAARWSGLRQDSGDPFEMLQSYIDYYRSIGIDPTTKVIMPSDGLTAELMIGLDERFGDQTILPFGVGTYLTNDTQIHPLSIVIKPIMANGHPCAKLSDNIAKATGDPATIERRRQEVDYHASYRLQPTY